MPPLLQRVERINLKVGNVSAATRFYVDTLGLRLDRQQHSAAALRFAHGDTELVLHDDRQKPDVEIVLGVADVQAIFDQREQLGVQFVSPPKLSGRGHRAQIRDPFGNVIVIADRGDAPKSAARSATGDGALFDDAPPIDPAADRAALIAVYEKIGRTADDLPYTPHFEKLHAVYTRGRKGTPPSHNDVWRLILTLRKSGKLPKMGVAVSKPPVLDPADKQRLRDLLGPDIGKRDRLPYTDRFDNLVLQFNKGFARAFSPHVVWRIVATLAK